MKQKPEQPPLAREDINRILKGVPREVADILRVAHAQKYGISRTGSFHFRITTPRGTPKRMVFAAATPSDWRSIKNMKSQLRRIGVVVPRS